MAAWVLPGPRPGWAYNPSGWSQRVPPVGAALLGLGVAGYLALYQWAVFATVWEPFFGVGYLLDAISGALGGRVRWRTMPWMVILFGLAVGPLGLVSVLLVIAQPLVYGSFCTLCLVSAFISINLIGPAVDETLVSLQYLKRERARGRSLWRAFRGLDAGAAARERSVAMWAQFIGASLGLWLLAAPAALGYADPARTNDRIVGPLVASIALIAVWEVARSARWANFPLGLWLLVAPWLLGYDGAATINSSLVGLALLGSALVRGIYRPGRFGGGWRALRHADASDGARHAGRTTP